MTDVELLPLPEPVAQCTNETALALADAPRSLRNYVAALQAEIEALRAEVSGLRAARIAYANEFPATEDGDPDTGNIHANIRALKARAARLAEALADIRSRSAMNLAMNPNPFELTALLGDIHQIAGAALAKENKA